MLPSSCFSSSPFFSTLFSPCSMHTFGSLSCRADRTGEDGDWWDLADLRLESLKLASGGRRRTPLRVEPSMAFCSWKEERVTRAVRTDGEHGDGESCVFLIKIIPVCHVCKIQPPHCVEFGPQRQEALHHGGASEMVSLCLGKAALGWKAECVVLLIHRSAVWSEKHT